MCVYIADSWIFCMAEVNGYLNVWLVCVYEMNSQISINPCSMEYKQKCMSLNSRLPYVIAYLQQIWVPTICRPLFLDVGHWTRCENILCTSFYSGKLQDYSQGR